MGCMMQHPEYLQYKRGVQPSRHKTGCDHVFVEIDETYEENGVFDPRKQRLVCCLCGAITTEKRF